MKDKKVTSLIFVLVLAIAIVASGTFAYWQWITSTAQETLVNVSLTDDATIYIDFPSEEITHMYPTSDCEANGTSSWVTEITVNNGTGVLMATNFKLKVKIEDKDGNVITNDTNEWNTNPLRYYIKYAVTEENEYCQNALITGRFDNNVLTYGNVANTDPKYSQRNDWYDSKSITKDGSDGFPLVSSRIGSGVAFHAHPNTSTSHTYKVWVWLDENYKSVTVGNDSTMDKMQDAKVTVSWSENSELEQVKQTQTPVGEAVAIYSADDQSLRFYRDNNPDSIDVGDIYNGRKVSILYRGLENEMFTPDWAEEEYYFERGETMPNNTICSQAECRYGFSIKKAIFEDYIYPLSTEAWFTAMPYLEYVDAIKLNTSNVTSMYAMFGSTSKSVDNPIVIGIEKWDTSNVIDMREVFDDTDIYFGDISGWNVCNVTEYVDFGTITNAPYFGDPARCNGGKPSPNYDPRSGEAVAIFSSEDSSLRFYRDTAENVQALVSGSISTYNGRSVTEIYTNFENASTVPWNTSSNVLASEIVAFEDYIYPVSTAYWFSTFTNCSSIDVSKLNTSRVTNMFGMFAYSSFTEITNSSLWDTSKVTNMRSMFEFSPIINIIGISNWDTSNVTDMGMMFYGATGFTGDLSNWNVCRVTQYDDFGDNRNIVEPNWGMAC